MEAAMTRSNAVLVLLDVLRRRMGRPVRVSDLYLYSREALVREAVGSELADSLRSADPSTIYLVLEELRSAGLVEAVGNTFTVTVAGEEAVRTFHEMYPTAVTDELTDVAEAVA
jgi:hypothetical protein